MRWATLVLVGAITGCGGGTVVVASSEAIVGPDGTEHFAIECRQKSANCFRRAGRVCPGGYTILERDGQTLTTVESDSVAASWGQVSRASASVRESRRYEGTMLIKCSYARPLAAVPVPTPVVAAPVAAGPLDAGTDNVQTVPAPEVWPQRR